MAGEFYAFGVQLRELVAGFLQEPSARKEKESPSAAAKPVWGRRVPKAGLPELFAGELAPKKHIRGVHPPAGIDNMRLKTVDVFRIPGMGEFTVPFEGYFQVTRSEPSTNDWKTATVYVNFTDLKLFGAHEKLGSIMVDLNPEIVSAGNTYPGRPPITGVVACKINVAARFHIESLGITLFNKTPIQLSNDDVQGIPTIGEGGKAIVNALPMYRWDDPDGELFGFVEEVEYMVLDYAPRDEVMKYRTATSRSHFLQLSGP